MSGLLKKRSREDQALPDSSKRLHGETERQILHLLEDIDSVDKISNEEKCGGPSEEVVNGVMKSLDEEIGVASCSTSYDASGASFGLKSADSASSDLTSRCETQGGNTGEINLGYLLEASDDELGIPPSPLQNFGDQFHHSSTEEGLGLSFDFAEHEVLKGSVENWHFENDFVDYSDQFQVFEYPTAWDVVSQGAFIDGDYSVPWRLETAGGMF